MDIFEKLKRLSAEHNAPVGKIEYIIAGLGNPGLQYENTRHNAGFMAVTALEEKYNFKCTSHKFKAVVADAVICGKRCLVMKPETYMNNSGEAISQAMDFYKIPAENIVVLYDDISLEPSFLRVRRKGSAGGHNGIKSIIALCDSDDFPRVKIGVGKKPHPQYNLADWVLSRFTDDDMKQMKIGMDKAVAATEYIVQGKIDEAMNKLN